MKKWVYIFSKEQTDGEAKMLDLLGGKGANLVEMSKLGLPVPPGFTITTDVCNQFYKNDKKFPEDLNDQVSKAINQIEELVKNQEAESVIENTSNEDELSFSQEAFETQGSEDEKSVDLKEFGVDTEEPDLFNSENQASTPDDLISSSGSDHDDDDLEIPAFLRRQKN